MQYAQKPPFKFSNNIDNYMRKCYTTFEQKLGDMVTMPNIAFFL